MRSVAPQPVLTVDDTKVPEKVVSSQSASSSPTPDLADAKARDCDVTVRAPTKWQLNRIHLGRRRTSIQVMAQARYANNAATMVRPEQRSANVSSEKPAHKVPSPNNCLCWLGLKDYRVKGRQEAFDFCGC